MTSAPAPARQLELRSYLVLLIVGSMLPFLVVSSLLLLRVLEGNRNGTAQTLIDSSRRMADALDTRMEDTVRSLQTLGASDLLAQGDIAGFDSVLRKASKGEGWMSARLTSGSGREHLIDTSQPPNAAPGPIADADSIDDVLRTHAPAVAALRKSPDGRFAFGVRVPVLQGAQVRYVLTAVLSSSSATPFSLQQSPEESGWTRAIVDSHGIIVARTPDPERFVGRRATPNFINRTVEAPDGMYRDRTSEGDPVYVAFAHATVSGWTAAVAVPVAVRDGQLSAATATLLAVSVLVLVLSGGGAYWLAGRISSDIGSATLAAEALARGETAPAAGSIVRDVTRLRQALAQSDALLRDRSEERDSHLARAEAALAHAEQSNAVKDQFLAMLGHELRNPLAPIMTALDVLRLRGGEWSHEHAVISRQVEHVSRLVDDLLDVSRITRHSVELRKTPTMLADVIARAAEMTSPLLEEHRHRLTIDVPDGLSVNGDATRLAQIFGNLLSNAARYTPDDGVITVRARRLGNEIAVDVIDNGRGIAPELAPRIFELFVQGRRTIDRQEGGMGLGLAIARSLVTLHDGRIEVRSEGEGCGSTFTVHLPATSTDQAADGLRQGAHAGHPLRVLIVDDNADAAEMLAMLLTGAGHEVATAADGPRALLLLDDLRPDVAVLDLGLPVMDGYELAARIAAATAPDPPVLVAVTGYGQAEDLARSHVAGFACHLVKPVSGDELLSLLGAIALSDARG